MLAVLVLLPYRFTLFSNGAILIATVEFVLLPYRFTLFSNIALCKLTNFVVLLPYRFTLFSNYTDDYDRAVEFYYLIDLHYSQTM